MLWSFLMSKINQSLTTWNNTVATAGPTLIHTEDQKSAANAVKGGEEKSEANQNMSVVAMLHAQVKNSLSSGRQRLAFAFFNCTKSAKLRRYQPDSTSLQSQFDRRSNVNGSIAR